jgi:hypothetical protein
MQNTTPSKSAPPQKPVKPEGGGAKDQPKDNGKKEPPQQQGQNQQQHGHGHRNQQNQSRGRGSKDLILTA